LRNVTVQQILLLIIFVALPLLNWLLRRVRQRRERQIPQPPTMPEMRRRATVSEPRSLAPQQLTRDRIQAQETPRAPVAGPQRGNSKSSLFRRKAEMRRAIILMTILGPCRAADPPKEQRDLSM
jgi:hypothetical protein